MSKTQIAFSYAGDIWIANREGGELRRLSDDGHDAKPIFSPDGSQIAFNRSGAVYVMPAAGGEPRRLTYHPADIAAVGWTPDGKRILFSSRRAAFDASHLSIAQLFTVPVTGGAAIPVPLFRAAEGSFSQDAARIAYVPILRRPWAWKRYRGGQTTPIWIANLADSRIEAAIPRDNSNDFNPMWVGNTIYFLSDRAGPVTLFSYDLKSRQVQQILQNTGLDLKSAVASSDAIVYEQFGSLHLLDLKSGRERALDLRPVADFPEVRPHLRKIEPGQLQLADISPTGEAAAFGVHGEILTVPAGDGAVHNLTRTSNAVERDPSWSPDGRAIAYFSDESGEYALHVRDRNDLRVRKINLGQPPTFYYSPRWSPDSKKIAYTDKRLNYWYVDLEKKVPVRVDADFDSDFRRRYQLGLQVAWSPDSRWIAYTKLAANHLRSVFLYSLERGKSYQLTDGMSDALYVAFDKGGKYLYFTASTDVALSTGAWDMSAFQHPVTRNVYVVLLERDLPSPLVSKGDADRSRQSVQLPAVDIDLENIQRRIVPLPIPARNYYGLLAGKPGVILLLEGPQIDPLFSTYSGVREPTLSVARFNLATGKLDRILDDVRCFTPGDNRVRLSSLHLSFNGERMLYAKGNAWFVAPVQKSSAGSAEEERPLNLDSMAIQVEPRAEWKHMYQQVWRNERDFFYDPNLHGLELADVKRRYEPYLENLSTRDDLNYLFTEMLGNLSVSHMLAVGGDIPPPRPSPIGLLGADYAVENGRYRFTHIYEGDTWNPDLRAPLAQPGVSVAVGDYLLRVNGREVLPAADIYSFFAETAGKQIVLSVGPQPDGSGAHDVRVIPVDDETGLRHYAWIEGNRRKVEQATAGRVGYVYLPNTQTDGYFSFNRYYFAQVGKEAVIIDERYNLGGRFPDYIVDYLSRPLLGNFSMREGADITLPREGIFGPKVMIINEIAASGGDTLPWMFRKLGLGPLIGERTWGGFTGVAINPDDLLDGGTVATPAYGLYDRSAAWAGENRGISPDIEIADSPQAERAGHDPQLEGAIQAVLQLLDKHPPPVQARPPYPNYQKSQPQEESRVP